MDLVSHGPCPVAAVRAQNLPEAVGAQSVAGRRAVRGGEGRQGAFDAGRSAADVGEGVDVRAQGGLDLVPTLVSNVRSAAPALVVDITQYGKKFTVRLRAIDRAGNVSDTPNRTWRR